MIFSLLAIFFSTLLISFIGSLPFGPINLVMIDTTLKNGLRTSVWFALAAALVEMPQAFVALQGSTWLKQLIYDSPWVKIAGFVFFVVLGSLFFFKKNHSTDLKMESPKRAFFAKGLAVAALNPQAIPFWVIVLAVLPIPGWFSINLEHSIPFVLLFSLGAAGGKLGALLLFGALSERIIHRSNLIHRHLHRIIGIILISVGLFQGILALVG
jgi:threonine/homoserine/homoserine lactone efflux protein